MIIKGQYVAQIILDININISRNDERKLRPLEEIQRDLTPAITELLKNELIIGKSTVSVVEIVNDLYRIDDKEENK